MIIPHSGHYRRLGFPIYGEIIHYGIINMHNAQWHHFRILREMQPKSETIVAPLS